MSHSTCLLSRKEHCTLGMFKRPFRLLLIAVATWGLAAGAIFSFSRQPVYADRSLSQWVERLAANGVHSPPQESEQAILGIGTNALPHLLKWIARKPTPPWRVKLNETVNRFTKRTLLIDKRSLRSQGALFAFSILGSEARPAIPALRCLVNNSKTDYSTSWRATSCLSHLGPEALPALLDALTNHFPGVRRYAADNFPSFGTNSRPAVPLLLLCLKDCSEDVAGAAAMTLGRLHLDASVVVPELTKSLQDLRPAVQRGAAIGLGLFGSEAQSALPALRQLEYRWGYAVAHALDQIDTNRPTTSTRYWTPKRQGMR